MQKCPTCGSMMQAHAHFCLACGTRIQRFAVVSDTVSVPYDEIAESELLRRIAERATSTSAGGALQEWPGATSSGVRAPDQQPGSGQAPRMVQPGPPPAARRRTGVAVIAFIVISIAAIWWAATIMAKRESPISPAAAILKSISGTRWRGMVGRSPAFLDVFAPGPNGNLQGRMNYEGIAEDLSVRVNPDGNIVLAGIAYRRESGSGPFALDNFYARLSADGRRLQGSLIDGAQRRGQWSVDRVEASESLAAVTVQLLSPGAISHWEGTIGKWPASLDIFARQGSGQWIARGSYHGVVEDFTVTIKDDGSLVLAGQDYYRQTGTGPFSLDTLYGRLSPDGQHLEGLRIDASTRGPWNVTRTGRPEQ